MESNKTQYHHVIDCCCIYSDDIQRYSFYYQNKQPICSYSSHNCTYILGGDYNSFNPKIKTFYSSFQKEITMRSRTPKRFKQKQTEHVQADTRNCKACWKCVDACPKEVIDKVVFLWHKHIAIQDVENCTGCRKCIKTCPYGVFVETNKSHLKDDELYIINGLFEC